MATEKRSVDSHLMADGGATSEGSEASSPPATSDARDRLGQVMLQARRAGFFPFMAAIERLTSQAVRVGGEGPLDHEAIRFRHDPALQFHTGDISEARMVSTDDPWGVARERLELVTTFMGLTGAASPLPSYMVEEVALEDGDRPILRDFYDIFHHRLISLLYRSVARLDHAAEFATDASDAWSRRVLALAGIDTLGETGSPQQTRLLLRLAPLLARRRRGAAVLEAAVAEALGDEVPTGGVWIEQFMGSWVPLDDRERMRLGLSNTTLGRTSVLGARAFDRSSRFRIHVGPVTPPVYARLQTGGDLLALVRAVVSATLSSPLDWDLEVRIAGDAQSGFRLGDRAPLGRSSWLSSSRSLENKRVVVEAGAAAGSLG